MTTVLVVGSGAREHALAWACAREGASVTCAPGNGGTLEVGENIGVAADDVNNVVAAARELSVDLVVIGPDAAIAAGLGDACIGAGIAVFGPTRAAGRIESSKEFAKALMGEVGIPTAAWRSGGLDDRDELVRFAAGLDGRCVVKADGLALGKGVVVCDSLEGAARAIDECLRGRRFGDAGSRVVVEELLHGREVSVLALCDGRRVRVLPPARDYKRAFDADRGPNTGGMGAYAPADLDVDALLDEVGRSVVQPCVDALAERGTPYAGCLYAGLMLTESGPRVLEFNARFGDPETQVVLPLLEDALLDSLHACARGELQPGVAQRRTGACVGVVAASAAYPEASPTGMAIAGLESLDPDVLCFHAGTVREPDGTVRTAGGRVLTVVAHGADLEAASARAYANLARIGFDGMRWRGDIARRRQAAPVAR